MTWVREVIDGTYRVLGVGHRVEGAECHGELVNDEVVGVVLLADDPPKALLVRSAVATHVSQKYQVSAAT